MGTAAMYRILSLKVDIIAISTFPVRPLPELYVSVFRALDKLAWSLIYCNLSDFFCERRFEERYSIPPISITPLLLTVHLVLIGST